MCKSANELNKSAKKYKEIEEEIKRCKESPAYLYNNYFKPNNAWDITDEDISNLKKRSIIKKRRIN